MKTWSIGKWKYKLYAEGNTVTLQQKGGNDVPGNPGEIVFFEKVFNHPKKAQEFVRLSPTFPHWRASKFGFKMVCLGLLD